MDPSIIRRGPRPSLAIFDPLSCIDLASLPPVPTTPPGIDGAKASTHPEVAPGRHDASVTIREDIGWTPMMKSHAALASFQPAQWTANGKLVDIITPMSTHRTLQARPVAESRVVVAERIEEECPPTIRKIEVRESEDRNRSNGSLERSSDERKSSVAGIAQIPMEEVDATPRPKRDAYVRPTEQSSIFAESPNKHTSASDSRLSASPADESIMHMRRNEQTPDESLFLPVFSSPHKSALKPAHNTSTADTTRFHGLTNATDDVSDLMGDDKSFMDAMMGSPSDSAEAESTRLLGTRAGQGKPESRDKGKGKARVMDSVREEPAESEIVERRQGFGSVLAGMAEYEASLGRNAASHEPQTRDTAAFQIVVSKASDSPSIVSAPPGSPVRRPNFTLLAVADQTGDVSTLFPSSPSIKRYMNAQAHRSSAADESRLDLVDLEDLRSVPLDLCIADEPDRTTHHADLDRSTLYPSSPAVKRNMARSTMDLMRDVQEEVLDSRLDQSVYLEKGKQRERPAMDTLSTAASSSAVTGSPTKRVRRSRRDSGDGNQTMDLDAMIKRTSRKLTTDCGDTTFLAPTSSAGRRALEQSMLVDVQSPFKSGGKEREVEESYYDLLGGDNTFMKQVEDVTIGDDSPVKGNILPPVFQTRHAVAAHDDFVFKVPELPSKIASGKAQEVSSITTSPTRLRTAAPLDIRNTSPVRSVASSPIRPRTALPLEPRNTSTVRTTSTSPTRSRTALPLDTVNTSPVRAVATSGTLSTPARSIGTATTRTMFTPSASRIAPSGNTHIRHLSSDYRSTTALPPRTPLAERGFGPQSAKKVSSSSVSTVLGETDGRSVNIRGQTGAGLGGMKRSATMNDFTPGRQQRPVGNEQTPRRRYGMGHARSPSDSAADVKPVRMTIPNEKRSSTLNSPTRLGHTGQPNLPAATSRVRLPGQGLRQVSGQGEVDNPDARTRKQAMSPEKLLQRAPRTTAVPQSSTSPSRVRTGFRPVPSQQSAPPRAVASSSFSRPATSQPRTSTARLPTSRTGSSSSMLTARSSALPPRTSTMTTSRPISKSAVPTHASSAATRMPAPSATMAGRTSNGLPRPSTTRPRTTVPAPAGTARPSSTSSITTKSRLVAPTTTQSRPGFVPTSRAGPSTTSRSTGLPVKRPEIEVARGRLDRTYAAQR